MAPGGETYQLYERFGENVLCHGSHEWLPYSKNAVRTQIFKHHFSFPPPQSEKIREGVDNPPQMWYIT